MESPYEAIPIVRTELQSVLNVRSIFCNSDGTRMIDPWEFSLGSRILFSTPPSFVRTSVVPNGA